MTTPRPRIRVDIESPMRAVEHAFETMLKVERSEKRVGVRNVFCMWPDIQRSFWEMYGSEAAQDGLEVRFVPTANQVSIADYVRRNWIPELAKWHEQTAKVICWRVMGLSWDRIAKKLPKNPSTGKQIHDKTVERLFDDGLLAIVKWEIERRFER